MSQTKTRMRQFVGFLNRHALHVHWKLEVFISLYIDYTKTSKSIVISGTSNYVQKFKNVIGKVREFSMYDNGAVQTGAFLLRQYTLNRIKNKTGELCRAATGIDKLDRIIDDILGQADSLDGKIIEICGKHKTGKTQLCYHLITSITFNYQIESLYIDTKNDFMLWRFKNTLKIGGWTEADITKLFNNVRYECVHEPERLIQMLHELNSNLDKHFVNLKLIVLDSLPSLLLQYGQNENDYKRKLILEITQLLRSIASRHRIIIFVTNFTKHFVVDTRVTHQRWMSHNHKNVFYLKEQAELEIEEFHYAVTKLWLFQPNFRIILETCGCDNDLDTRREKRLVIFVDVHNLKQDYECYIEIGDLGVQPWVDSK